MIPELLPELTLVAFALAIPCISYISKNKKIIGYFSIIGFLLSLIAVLEISQLSLRYSLYNDMILIDSFSIFFKSIFLCIGLLVAIASLDYIEGNYGEYYSLLMLSILGMMFVASANDLIFLFIGIEIASVSTYILVAFRKKDKLGSEAGMKYFIIGAFSSALLLYGISLLYGIANTTNIFSLKERIGEKLFEPIAVLAIVFLIAGFGFKMAAVPFHMWAPDTYEGAPTTITALLASASKKVGFAAAMKVFIIGMLAVKINWSVAFGIIAIVTMSVGNIIAIAQNSVKRMLAYSSIAQAGYIMIAFAVLTKFAIAGSLLHILTHAIMCFGAFIVVAIVVGENIDDYAGLRRRAPFTAFAMTIFLLSLAGLPPLSGFISKFVLFSAAIQAGGWVVWLAVAGVLNSALSLYYYARVIKYMYVVAPSEKKEEIKSQKWLIITVIIAFALTVIIGIYPGPFIDFAIRGAGGLLPS
ncbi:MAG: NADH-quinone oxidoreductase subunit N [Candidatus Thermoplasmatota archaeon]